MRIVLIHNFSTDTNGEDIYFLSLVKLLQNKHHTIFLYTKNNKFIKSDLLNQLGIIKRMFANELVENELRKIINRFKPDVVHIHNVYPLISPTIYRICKTLHVPIVQTIHNYRFMCAKGILFRDGKVCELCVGKKVFYPSIIYGCYHNSRLGSFVFSSSFSFHQMRKSFDCIDHYVFTSAFTRNYYLKNLDLAQNKTTVIPHFVSLGIRKISDPNRRSCFLFVGRLAEEKGIISLLDLFVTLPKLKLVVIGSGPLRGKINQYKKYKNILVKKFLPREEVFRYMRNALCTIIPSLFYETGPLVMIESFANGIPVIVPKFGSFEEAVEDGKTGIFFKYNDFEDLRDKILYVSENKPEIEKMQKFIREEYLHKYTPEKHYYALLKVYKKLVR